MFPFFDILEGGKRFEWTPECEQPFEDLKVHLNEPHILSKPIEGEQLIVYLAVSSYSISTVLVRDEDKLQHPVYYINKKLLDLETRCPNIEKLALALVVASRKLRSYFHTHPISILTSYPLKNVLQKPYTSDNFSSGRWSWDKSKSTIGLRSR